MSLITCLENFSQFQNFKNTYIHVFIQFGSMTDSCNSGLPTLQFCYHLHIPINQLTQSESLKDFTNWRPFSWGRAHDGNQEREFTFASSRYIHERKSGNG